MAIIRQSPRVFNTSSTGGIVAATSGFNFQFGFRPIYMRVENIGTIDIWATFNSTEVATTSGLLIRACEPSRVFELTPWKPVCPAVMSLAATSTLPASGATVFALGEL